MKIKINDQSQLTLSLPSRAPAPHCRPRRRRHSRATMWFQHMRHVVDQAPEPQDQNKSHSNHMDQAA